MNFHNRKSRSRERPQSAQQQNLDKQILCLHKAMAEKIIANHDFIPQIQQTIEARYESGKMRYGAYLFWSSLLEFIDEPELFLSQLLAESPQTRKYRRQTPFVGVLTEQERQAVLEQLLF
ncbi:hypothetical protein [uncultured Paraglaciecola sp.]|uniref:hypothetical protein n=1 Tax=uncultured Paraglaciecola sp. TaxID=1765024 RepID=UPI002594EB5D|nr:hypothetical protein [uncultured Paraglaciecola sp.]